MSKRISIIIASAVLVGNLAIPGTSPAITRKSVVDRGARWIAAETPYSQSRYATVAGSLVPTSASSPSTKGYRTDCSGFVSMCLDLRTGQDKPKSYNTATLDDILVPIAKEDLRPGDVILRPKDLKIDGKTVPYGHAVLFVDWADDEHTSYIGYHESSSQRGAVRDVIEWGASGFWTAKGFSAYRCPTVRERVRVKPAEDK
jgi:hypothetical protein